MDPGALTTYLNDHKAGSVLAIELVEHLVSEDAGRGPLVGILAELRASRTTLEQVFDLLDLSPNPIKQVGAWLAEKFARLKTGGRNDGGIERLEALETLAMGIQGQMALWRVLNMVVPGEPRLRQINFVQLERSARELYEQVEQLRLEAARAAFMS